MEDKTFKALIITETDDKQYTRQIRALNVLSSIVNLPTQNID